MSRSSPGPILLCAGQYGSASTWLYNAAQAMLRAAQGGAALHSQFADSADDLPERPDDRALVLKAHVPRPSLSWLLARSGGRAIVTLRDPRDAAASLIHRFGFGYPLVSARLARSGAALPLLVAAGLPCLLLRYEDGFAAQRGTLDRIADFLGLTLPAAALDAVFARLTPQAVRAEIARIASGGGFGEAPTSHNHDAVTHWHPGHVGDGEVGKFATVLTEGQVGDIIRRTRPYQAAFGYPMPPLAPLAPGRDLPVAGWGPGLAYLGEGFGPPDERGVWTEAPEARLHLPGAAGAWIDLDLELPRRGRPPVPNPMRWSLRAEDGALLHGPMAAAETPERHQVSLRLTAPGDLILRFEDLAPARAMRFEGTDRLLGLRLLGFGLRAG